jgi:phosphoribosylformylglycinamidine synthase
MATDAIVSIQDMGAAGLTSSSVEMSAKGGLGIELDLDKVPMREPGMTAYELMLSESQERMLMVLKPEAMATARAIFDKWELDFAEIGRLTDTGRLVLRMRGAVAADMPVQPLVEEAPVYDRPCRWTPVRDRLPRALPTPLAPIDCLKKLIACPDIASRRWVWEQYDHLVRGDTVQRPGGDAAVVRIAGTERALAMTVDCTPRYCLANPHDGGAQAVVETWRNLTAVGALPIAVTDNMNFGNPQRPETMGQFAGCIEGIRSACLALAYPVVSGNVSFYNETNGQGVLPTPAIGGVGLVEDIGRIAITALRREGEALLLVGGSGEPEGGHLGCSLYLREILGREDGTAPALDFAAERRNGDFVRALIRAGSVTTCHDVSDGGLLVALAEMAMAGGLGAELAVPAPFAAAPHPWLFGEDQGRYIVAVAFDQADAVLAAAAAAAVAASRIGVAGGAALTLRSGSTISGAVHVAELKRMHEAWFPAFMDA